MGQLSTELVLQRETSQQALPETRTHVATKFRDALDTRMGRGNSILLLTLSVPRTDGPQLETQLGLEFWSEVVRVVSQDTYRTGPKCMTLLVKEIGN